MDLLRLLAVLSCVAGLIQSIAATPPSFACGKLRDYYAKETVQCAEANCNAAPRNLGGDVLVLDIDSYGERSCQGCNPSIPSTCCEKCKNTDRCNAWVVCTNPDGCGSGCAAYAKQLASGLPVSYDAPLPHKGWGNWGGCSGDKWRFGTCSLKVVKDVKQPPVTSSKASDGWVSGIVPKVSAGKGCPAWMSAANCKACLATPNPTKCISCIESTNTMNAGSKCSVCASLSTPLSQDACIKCNSYECKQCLDADCTDSDCMNAFNKNPAKAPNLASMDQCFACVGKAAGGAAATKQQLEGGKASVCNECFRTYNVPKEKRQACVNGVIAATSTAVAAGIPGCYGSSVQDGSKCQSCLSKAKTPADGSGCGACSNTNQVPSAFTAACYECVLKAPSDAAKQSCSNLASSPDAKVVSMFYKCLSTAKDSDTASSCWQCSRENEQAAAKCFACMDKVKKAENRIHCSHCWTTNRITEQGGAVSAKCESCVLNKEAAGQAPDVCW